MAFFLTRRREIVPKAPKSWFVTAYAEGIKKPVGDWRSETGTVYSEGTKKISP
jgi:hypothetical protein